ncbi:class I adenylate-forming enzyme family protein [Cochlodiniinecator piscidefendens]|uniref:class I adenylate-forming enzyme family protein n=1 Tax=Cochlodiniinecator piscidefendens TaxID=2715756 RepID=UPI0014082C06|nr:class I adenylate-forming enzyme family protein [Cochlodiniinecator piscidefendens]
MQSIFDNGAPTPCPNPFNMAAYVLSHGSTHTPDHPALEILHSDRVDSWSYLALEQAVRGIASGLLAEGLTAGDRVLMRLENSVGFPLTYLACIAVDLIPVPTAAQLTAPEVAKMIAELSPSLIIKSDGVACPETACPVLSEKQVLEMQSLPPAHYVMGDPERLAYIIYTSGTSGTPRAVCHAHRAIWARRMMWDGWYGLRPSDRLLHAGAFNWTYTLGTGLMDPWTMGATALIPAPGTQPTDLPRLIRDHSATIFAAAPGVCRQILKQIQPLDAPALRHGLSAGEKLPERTRLAWEELSGTSIYEAFGMSECSTFLSGSPSRPAPEGSSGYAQNGRRIAVLGDDHHPVPFGVPGILANSKRDPGLMLGYWEAEDETNAKFSGEWFLTGDTVCMAADGAITYLGRSDDMMNAGGFRVSPLEVEAVINQHPEIQECAAAEVSIKADTTVITVFYVAEHEIAQHLLNDFVITHLARYKTPRLFVRVSELHKGANGKLLRKTMRSNYENAQIS